MFRTVPARSPSGPKPERPGYIQAHPELGFKKLDTHRSPVIGPRLIGTSSDGRTRAVLTIISLKGTYLAKTTRIAVDKIMDWLKVDRPPPPTGLELALTGSAVVGHDINTAANESIANTTWTTVVLVILILLFRPQGLLPRRLREYVPGIRLGAAAGRHAP